MQGSDELALIIIVTKLRLTDVSLLVGKKHTSFLSWLCIKPLAAKGAITFSVLQDDYLHYLRTKELFPGSNGLFRYLLWKFNRLHILEKN